MTSDIPQGADLVTAYGEPQSRCEIILAFLAIEDDAGFEEGYMISKGTSRTPSAKDLLVL